MPLTKAHGAQQDAARVIVRQCEDYLQTGDVARCWQRELAQPWPRAAASRTLPLFVDRDKARFGASASDPRSQSVVSGRRGRSAGLIARVPAAMGFDVLFLATIHPHWPHPAQGPRRHTVERRRSPAPLMRWEERARDALVGTIEDFRALVATCLEYGLELALDFAVRIFAGPPVADGPEWFKWRRTVRTVGAPIPTSSSPISDRAGLWNAFRDAMCSASTTASPSSPSTITTPRAHWRWLIRDIRRRIRG